MKSKMKCYLCDSNLILDYVMISATWKITKIEFHCPNEHCGNSEGRIRYCGDDIDCIKTLRETLDEWLMKIPIEKVLK